MENDKNNIVGACFVDEEKGYNNWFEAKIEVTIDGLKDSSVELSKHDDVMDRVAKLLK